MSIQKNKQLVSAFIDLAFVQKKPEEAAERYLGEPYIQHNPNAKDGRDAFGTLFASIFKDYPDSEVITKRILAEGDLVMLHIHAKKHPEDLGEAVAEIFRIENDKIVEHWDIVQNVPKHSANSHGMF